MGLDMYLEKVNRDENGNLILEEIFDWRKAYVIMDFFNTNLSTIGVDNCARYNLDRNMLMGLLDFCNRFLGEGPYDEGMGFHVLDGFIVKWAEDEDDYEYQKEWVILTKEFLESHLSNIDEAFNDFYMFHAWW